MCEFNIKNGIWFDLSGRTLIKSIFYQDNSNGERYLDVIQLHDNELTEKY